MLFMDIRHCGQVGNEFFLFFIGGETIYFYFFLGGNADGVETTESGPISAYSGKNEGVDVKNGRGG